MAEKASGLIARVEVNFEITILLVEVMQGTVALPQLLTCTHFVAHKHNLSKRATTVVALDSKTF